MAAFSVPAAPVITSVPLVFVPPKTFEMATAPEKLIVFTPVLLIVPVLVKSPAASDPEVSRVPKAPTLKEFVPAATAPPFWITSVPPLTVLLAPLRVRVFVPVPRLPPVWLKVPPTLTAPLIVTAPVTVRLTKSGLAALPPVSVTVWPVPLKLALAPLSTNPAALMSATVPSSIPCVRVICPLLSPPDSWRALVVSVLFSVMGPNVWPLEASVTGVLEPLKVIVEPLLV